MAACKLPAASIDQTNRPSEILLEPLTPRAPRTGPELSSGNPLVFTLRGQTSNTLRKRLGRGSDLAEPDEAFGVGLQDGRRRDLFRRPGRLANKEAIGGPS